MKEHKLQIGKVIEDNAKEYFHYYVYSQFPNIIDGLKAVHRRVIYSLRDNNEISNADTISKIFSYHPHSHEAIYETIVRMSQPFHTQIPLFKFTGNNGSYSNPKGYSASRYTRGELSQFARDLFLNDINLSTLKYRPTEDLEKVEPCYFIPKIPTTLLFNFNNVGYGFTSRGINFQLKDVCDLTIQFIQDPDSIIRMYDRLVPYYYGCSVRNFHEIYSKFTNNEFNEGAIRIYLETRLHVENNVITIEMVPPTTSFPMIEEKLLKLLKDKNSWLGKNCVDFKNLADRRTKYNAKLYIKFKRNTNLFEMIDKLNNYITDTYSVFNNYEIDNHITNCSIFKLLRYWFNERRRSVMLDFRQKLINISYNIDKLTTYLLVRQHVDDVINIIKSNNEQDGLNILFNKYKLSYKQCKIIMDANLRVLSKTSIEQITNKINKLKQEKEEIENILVNDGVNNYIKSEVLRIKDKYTTKKYQYYKWDTIRNYIGLLATKQGYVLIENKNDLIKNIENINSVNEPLWYINFIKHNKFLNNNIFVNQYKNQPLRLSNTRTTKYSLIPSIEINSNFKYTIHINHSRKSSYLYNGIYIYVNLPSNSEKDYFNYVNDNLNMIDENWNIVQFNASELLSNDNKRYIFTGKKYIAGFSYLIDYPATEDYPYILVFKNLKLGKLFLHKLYPSINKLIFPSYGEYVILDVIPNNRYEDNYYYINKKWYSITINDNILKKLKKDNFIDFNLNSRGIRL